MMKKVLVTGGNGFIGRNTLSPLLDRGYEVHVATLKGSKHLNNLVTFHNVDLLDCATHASLIKSIQPTHLLHTAWYTENGKFWDAVENVYWLKATISLAEEFYKQGGVRFLGLGTCAEYDWSDGLCIEKSTPELPASLYGKSKLSTYESLAALSGSYSRDFAWARIFFPYGPGESGKRLIPYVISSLLRDEEAQCTHGNQLRDFMHVRDIGNALAATLDSDATGVINIGSGHSVSIKDIVVKISKILNKEKLIKLGAIPDPAYSPKQIVADINRLKNEINWSSHLSLDEGLLDTVNWWRENESARLTSGELINENGN